MPQLHSSTALPQLQLLEPAMALIRGAVPEKVHAIADSSVADPPRRSAELWDKQKAISD